jgi:hypothetical protein
MTWKHIVMGLVGFSFGLWFCYPREMALEPRWEVLVQDADGHGLLQAEVFQTRYDYATGGGRSETLRQADSYGRVAFPAVSAHTSPLLRTITCVRLKASGKKASCGFHQIIVAAADGYVETARQEGTLPLKGRGELLTVTMQKH